MTETLNVSSIIPGVTRMQDVDGYVGTIVYVGPVASAKDPDEKYAGVIWDDASRGKHDGSVICRRTNQFVRHFSCPHPCGASFIRLSKLNLGVPLNASVLRSKYVTADSEELVAPNNLLVHTARTSSGREKPIEFHGELKIRRQQQLEDLNTISLRRMGIARLEKESLLSLKEFEHLTALDLTGNLLSEWETVLMILALFPNLIHFNVAANRIRDPPNHIIDNVELQSQQLPFSDLQVLNLNQCGIESVNTLLWIGKLFPKLQSLCVAHADLSKLDVEFGCQAAATMSHLTQLDLTDCKLASWNQQVVPLCSTLPCLELLHLDDNPIVTTNLEHDKKKDDANPTNETTAAVYFPQLQSLQLADTQIRDWQELDGLSCFPKLTSLRFRRCPLLSTMGTGEARAITIARLGNLTKLNSTSITLKEREDAERRYVSSVACQLLPFPSDKTADNCSQNETVRSAREEFLLEGHKPFKALLEKHREAIAASTIFSSVDSTVALPGDSPRSVTTTTAGVVVVNVTIQSMAASSCQQEPMVRRLPGSLPVKRVKAMCARFFGLDPDLQRLHFCTEFDAFPTELDDDEHTLAYYGVSDGATIFMNEINMDEILEQKEKHKQKQLSLLERQEALESKKQRHKQHLLHKLY